MYRKFYFFEITNPEEIKNGSKPRVIERGPYTYLDKWEKRNVEFLDKDKLKYTPVSSIHFESSLSVGNETDTITFLNIPAAVNIHKFSQYKFINRILIH